MDRKGERELDRKKMFPVLTFTLNIVGPARDVISPSETWQTCASVGQLLLLPIPSSSKHYNKYIRFLNGVLLNYGGHHRGSIQLSSVLY